MLHKMLDVIYVPQEVWHKFMSHKNDKMLDLNFFYVLQEVRRKFI